jgi:hypothetical protein
MMRLTDRLAAGAVSFVSGRVGEKGNPAKDAAFFMSTVVLPVRTIPAVA